MKTDGLNELYQEVLFDQDGVPKIPLDKLKELIELFKQNRVIISKYPIGTKIYCIFYTLEGIAEIHDGTYDVITPIFCGEEEEGWFLDKIKALEFIDKHNSDPERIKEFSFDFDEEFDQ